MPTPSDGNPDQTQPNDFANAVNTARQNTLYKPVPAADPDASPNWSNALQKGMGLNSGDGASWFPKQLPVLSDDMVARKGEGYYTNLQNTVPAGGSRLVNGSGAGAAANMAATGNAGSQRGAAQNGGADPAGYGITIPPPSYQMTMSSVQSPQPSEVRPATPAPAGIAPPVKQYAVNPTTGTIRLSPYFPPNESIMQARKDGVLKDPQALDWIKRITPVYDEGADDTKVGGVADFFGRAGVRDAQILNVAGEGVTGMFGKNPISNYFKNQVHVLDQAEKGQLGNGKNIMNPARNNTWGGFAGDTTGDFFGYAPAGVMGGELEGAAAKALEGLGMAGKVGTAVPTLIKAAPKLVEQLPTMAQSMAQVRGEAYNDALKSGKSEKDANSMANWRGLEALPGAAISSGAALLPGGRIAKVPESLFTGQVGKVVTTGNPEDFHNITAGDLAQSALAATGKGEKNGEHPSGHQEVAGDHEVAQGKVVAPPVQTPGANQLALRQPQVTDMQKTAPVGPIWKSRAEMENWANSPEVQNAMKKWGVQPQQKPLLLNDRVEPAPAANPSVPSTPPQAAPSTQLALRPPQIMESLKNQRPPLTPIWQSKEAAQSWFNPGTTQDMMRKLGLQQTKLLPAPAAAASPAIPTIQSAPRTPSPNVPVENGWKKSTGSYIRM